MVTKLRNPLDIEPDLRMRFAFVNSFPPGPLRFAALSVATARWDDVQKDVARGRLTVEQAATIYGQAVAHQVATPAMAEHQVRLIQWLGNVPSNQQSTIRGGHA